MSTNGNLTAPGSRFAPISEEEENTNPENLVHSLEKAFEGIPHYGPPTKFRVASPNWESHGSAKVKA